MKQKRCRAFAMSYTKFVNTWSSHDEARSCWDISPAISAGV